MANEKRLVDANAPIEEVKKNNKSNFYEKDWSSEDVCILLRKFAPTVDAVEVVRCKDCKCNGECSIQDAMNWTPRTEIGDWFCSNGERRGNG